MLRYHLQKIAGGRYLLGLLIFGSVLSGLSIQALAEPYGTGKYGADVPYGSQTSLTINTGSNVAIQITPTPSGVIGTGSNTVTVTSTDVVGYSLYIQSLSSTDMTNNGALLPASGNTSAGSLATNTWGYNATGSTTNFIGITSGNTLLKSASGPFESGDTTTVTYGVKIDDAKPAGNYVTSVVYTAAPQTN